MAETTNFIMTTTYQQVVSIGENYSLQNVGKDKIEIIFSDITPTTTDKGYILETLKKTDSSWGDGNIWARVKGTGGGLLAVTPFASIQDVNLLNKTSPVMIVKFNKILSSTTTVGAVAIGQTTVELANMADAIVGTYLIFFNPTEVRYMVATITSIAASPVVQLDRPFDFAYPSGSFVDKTTTNMAVDGTLAAPQVFGLRGTLAPPGVALTVDITRIIITAICTSAVDLAKFANFAKLPNGLLFRRRDGRYANNFNVKDNGEIAGLCYDFRVAAATNPQQGVDGFTARLTFAGQNKIGVALRIALGEDIECLVQDLLATAQGGETITSLEIMAEGHEVQD